MKSSIYNDKKILITGTYVEPENIDNFNQAIRNYLKNPQLLKEQGMNGYNYAKVNFDRSILAVKYLEKISQLK